MTAKKQPSAFLYYLGVGIGIFVLTGVVAFLLGKL
jgi:hypothetical protein